MAQRFPLDWYKQEGLVAQPFIQGGELGWLAHLDKHLAVPV
jgi:hypothetical protein